MDGNIGEIRLFAGDYPPLSWAYCDGSLMSAAIYEEAYGIFGNRFGGDVDYTFALPLLSAPPGVHYITCVEGQYPPIGDGSGVMPGTMGEVRLFAGAPLPNGWLYCDGSLMGIEVNAVFYSLLLNVYGGDGHTTFALPRLPDPAPGVKYIICETGIYPSKKTG